MAPQKSLKESAKQNPTLIGDPTSLKAEQTDSSHSPTSKKSSNQPDEAPTHTPSDTYQNTKSNPAKDVEGYDIADKKSAGSGIGGGKKNKLRESYMKGNPSQLGDPVSLKAEAVDSHPTDQDLGAGRTKSKL